ncbi:hypothetical protein SAMN05421503_2163, partial [Terribacillus aidingensis]
MSPQNIIVNGGFESGSLEPWVSSFVFVTQQYTNSGSFAAVLDGGQNVDYLAQYASPIVPGNSYTLTLYMAKASILPAPPVQIQLLFLTADFQSVGRSTFLIVPTESIPFAELDNWRATTVATDVAPEGAAQIFLLINTLPDPGSTDILVDDVSVTAVGTGPTGPTGATGATGP